MATSNLVTPSNATPDQSRRPSSVRTGQEDTDLHQHQHQYQQHHHQHNGAHPTNIAALAAAATAVAAASPSPGATLPALALAATPGIRRSKQEDTVSKEDGQEEGKEKAAMADLTVARVVSAELCRAQKKQKRDVGRLLRDTLAELDGVSTSTSRRLDATYRAVLSRVTALQGTALALRSLAAAARATNRRFRAETQALASEIEQQVDAFDWDEGAGWTPKIAPAAGTPSDQQRRLVELHDRVRVGRKAALELSDRVDVVRLRVDSWSLADRAWQERTRTRLKFLWLIVSSIVLALVVMLFVTARYSTAWGGGAGNTTATGSISASATARSTAAFSLPFLGSATRNANASERENPLAHLLDEL